MPTAPLRAPGTLTTGAVSLVPVDARTPALLVAASRDPEITRWTQVPDDLRFLDAQLIAARWQAQGVVRLQVCVADGDPAGMVSLWVNEMGRAEVGYWLLRDARGRGSGTVAVRLLCDWALAQAGHHVLQLTTLAGNVVSEGVAERCGFVRVGHVDRDVKGRVRTLRLWERTRLGGAAVPSDA